MEEESTARFYGNQNRRCWLFFGLGGASLVSPRAHLLRAGAHFQEAATPATIVKVLAGAVVVGLFWSFLSWRKGAVRRQAVDLLSNGHDGITAWNRWRESETEFHGEPERFFHIPKIVITPLPDLRRVNIANKNLGNANLRSLNLEYAYLSNCDLSRTDLMDTRLNHCSLRNARLPKP